MNEENCKKIRDLLEKISKCNSNNSPYFEDKKIISGIFDITQKNGLDPQAVRIRLTVLDSMYSTQMSMRPYGLDDLAQKLWETYYQNKKDSLKTILNKVVEKPKEENIPSLFTWTYGFKKKSKDQQNRNTNKKGNDGKVEEDGAAKAVSLISKYFYFETDYGFPIYDSIVRKYLPLLYRYCGIEKCEKIPNNNICKFIKAINDFFLEIKYTRDQRRYDYLDHLLWVIGKILRGNLSLVLTKKEYQEITEKIEYKKIESNKNKDSFNFIKNHKADYEAYINKLIKVLPDDDMRGKIANIALELVNTIAG